MSENLYETLKALPFGAACEHAMDVVAANKQMIFDAHLQKWIMENCEAINGWFRMWENPQ